MMMATPATCANTWLRERGYDSSDDLCVAKLGSGWTLMHQACDAGALHVCKWLVRNGASSTLRTKDSEGWTPMFRACEYGHLHVAQVWFEGCRTSRIAAIIG